MIEWIKDRVIKMDVAVIGFSFFLPYSELI